MLGVTSASFICDAGRLVFALSSRCISLVLSLFRKWLCVVFMSGFVVLPALVGTLYRTGYRENLRLSV